jgi:hypothetical protein
MENKNQKNVSSEQHVTATNQSELTKEIIQDLTEYKTHIYMDFVKLYNQVADKQLNQVPIYSFERNIVHISNDKNGCYTRDFEKVDDYIINLIETECRNNYQAAVDLWFSLFSMMLMFLLVLEERPQLKQEYNYFKNWVRFRFNRYNTAISKSDFRTICSIMNKQIVD